MAATVSQVEQIIDTEQSDDIIQSYLDAADSYMGAVLSSGDLTSSQQDEIQRWLAAHMLAVTWDRQGKKEKIGDANVEYTGEFKQKLESTTYGQMVLMLDTSGRFAKAGKKAIVFKALNEESNSD